MLRAKPNPHNLLGKPAVEYNHSADISNDQIRNSLTLRGIEQIKLITYYIESLSAPSCPRYLIMLVAPLKLQDVKSGNHVIPLCNVTWRFSVFDLQGITPVPAATEAPRAIPARSISPEDVMKQV